MVYIELISTKKDHIDEIIKGEHKYILIFGEHKKY